MESHWIASDKRKKTAFVSEGGFLRMVRNKLEVRVDCGARVVRVSRVACSAVAL